MLKISTESLDWALEHAKSKGDTDIFPTAFEFAAIEYTWDDVRAYLAHQDVLTWATRPLRRSLSPKRRYGFRIATQLDPLDFLLFAALIYELGPDLESHRLGTDTVMSCRFGPDKDGEIFDPQVGYPIFLARSRALALDCSRVVVTDIADFFPRLYLHRVEGALSNATSKANHVLSISSLLSQWNQTQSYGIPIGPAPARLVAELAIDDVDKILRSENITFVRYMDDYRIFAQSDKEGYSHLATLANALFKNHGLTLQQEKTYITTKDEFLAKIDNTEESEELVNLETKFDEFLKSAGIEDDPYGLIEYEDLSVDDRDRIDALNLVDLLQEQLQGPSLDQRIVRFLLRRLGQLGDDACVDDVLKNAEKLFTVFPDVIQYLSKLRNLTDAERQNIGKKVLILLNGSSVSQLDFHKVWLFSLFSGETNWGIAQELASLYTKAQDNFSKRELTIALGRFRQGYWFRTRKEEVLEFGGWLRRAFLAGASCLPADERKHWYKFLESRLDILEHSVVKWARSSPW